MGVRGGAVGWGTALQAGRSRVRYPMVSLEFFIYYGPVVDSASNRNEYQEYFLLLISVLEIWEPRPPGTLTIC